MSYQNSFIYIVRWIDNPRLCYIGSSIHIERYKYFCSYHKKIKDYYDIDNFKNCYCQILQFYPCNNKDELNKKKYEIINQYDKDNNYKVLNILKVYGSYNDKEIKNLWHKQYRLNNKMSKTTS